MIATARRLLLVFSAVASGCLLDWQQSWPLPKVDAADASADSTKPYLGTDGPTSDLPPPDGSTSDLPPPDGPTADLTLPEILWSAGHESGDLDEWGGPAACNSENGGTCTLVSMPTHAGSWAVDLAIGPPGGGRAAAQLQRHEPNLPVEGYFSAWYLIPSGAGAEPESWYDIMSWQSIQNTDVSPMYVLGFNALTGGDRNLVLRYRPTPDGSYNRWTSTATLDRGVWFHLEVYYFRSSGTDGEIRVWQDGQEIFHRRGDPTVLPGGELTWSVGLYAEQLIPGESMTIFVDDAAIAIGNRVGP